MQRGTLDNQQFAAAQLSSFFSIHTQNALNVNFDEVEPQSVTVVERTNFKYCYYSRQSRRPQSFYRFWNWLTIFARWGRSAMIILTVVPPFRNLEIIPANIGLLAQNSLSAISYW